MPVSFLSNPSFPGARRGPAGIITYCQPLSVINLAGAEECLQGIITRKHETSEIDQELAADVEED